MLFVTVVKIVIVEKDDRVHARACVQERVREYMKCMYTGID